MANIVLLSIFSIIQFLHPIHVSVTEIEHDLENRSLEMVMRVFIDDLELDIREELREPALDITMPGANRTSDQILKPYLKKHFKVWVNGKDVNYEYLGHELELPVIYLYLEVKNVKKVKEISIFNDMIMNAYDDQSNLVHVEVGDETKSLKLVNDRKTDILTF